jgi:hypothetical protein
MQAGGHMAPNNRLFISTVVILSPDAGAGATG